MLSNNGDIDIYFGNGFWFYFNTDSRKKDERMSEIRACEKK